MSDAAGKSALMLERDEQLQTADSALRAAEDMVLEGPAGIGKTSLLAAIARRAQHRRMTCLQATAGERERGLQWSVVRGLVAGPRALSDRSRTELEQGPARALLPPVAGPVAPGAPADIDWLRRGLDLADRCDADLLARQAHAALVAHGTRPRRRRLSGAETLTPIERRVAERAARGTSNRQIAQSLFLSLRTVESHLTSACRKLRIESRADLAGALFGDRSVREAPADPWPRQ